VIFIDEIDIVRSLPFSTDEFFAAIRECYNRRAEEPEFERLTFCLIGVATPSDLIRDVRLTPFNIGRRIELNDFTPEEAVPLASGLGPEALGLGEGNGSAGSLPEAAQGPTPDAQRLLERILYWTGGHPYLTQRLCQAVADGHASCVVCDASHPSGRMTHNARHSTAIVDRACEELFLSARAREQDDNLLFVREWLLKGGVDLAGLLEQYGRVRAGKRVAADDTNPLIDVLRLSGIVRLEAGGGGGGRRRPGGGGGAGRGGEQGPVPRE
jgi:hypothetical protein